MDEKAVRVENIFLDFLKSFRISGGGGDAYYEAEIEAMSANESSTMFIDFSHVMVFNNLLQKAISDEFLRSIFLQSLTLKPQPPPPPPSPKSINLFIHSKLIDSLFN